MFSNSGEKIKKLVEILFIIELVISFSSFFVFILLAIKYEYLIFKLLIFSGPPVLFALFYIIDLFLYGFGELITNTQSINTKTQKIIAQKNKVKNNNTSIVSSLDREVVDLPNKKEPTQFDNKNSSSQQKPLIESNLNSQVKFDIDSRIRRYDCAFNNHLINFEIPSNIQCIETRAFFDCKSLKTVFIPKSVIFIAPNAFSKCPELIIRCENKSKPIEWDKDWNSENNPVEWGCPKPI